jgi:hypothetical protein
LDGVINEEFLGELMQDLGVPMSEEALKGWFKDQDNDEKDKDKKDKEDK